MRRFTLLAIVALAFSAGPSRAGLSLDLHVHEDDAPPPPPPTVIFEDEPAVVLVPSSRVYYVPDLDYDLYRYGRSWYINRGGHWYRASGYRGPFVYIGYDRVPTVVLHVPPKYRRHPLGGPPGQTGVHPWRREAREQDHESHRVWKRK